MKDLSLDVLIERAEVLIEAMPYIRKHRDGLVVIKYGGAAMTTPELKQAVVKDVAMMQMIGILPIMVHGGGKEITELQNRLGEKTTFIDGQRVTDTAALDAAEMILSGRLNGELVAALNTSGARAVGISGKGGTLLRARALKTDAGLGFVGEVEQVDATILNVLTGNGFIPVVSPLGLGADGQTYNINADTAALRIATEVKARKLIFLSDIPGILRDRDDPGSVIGTIRRDEVEPMIAEGIIQGGMIPKARAAASALDACEKVHILDGRRPHSLLLELFTDEGIGTQIVR
ncbi:MAG: acetylglutamate kinase [Candidatus Sumerlaeota bacterium]|nr:acetylglutamate kinase [Candidatus Sumerlaeota bacterium]